MVTSSSIVSRVCLDPLALALARPIKESEEAQNSTHDLLYAIAESTELLLLMIVGGALVPGTNILTPWTFRTLVRGHVQPSRAGENVAATRGGPLPTHLCW